MRGAGPLGLALLLIACGGGEDATMPLTESEPDARERRMLDDAASMLDDNAAEPPLPAGTAAQGNDGR